MRSENAIHRADLSVLVVDATSGVTAQDKKIAGLIQKADKAAVVALNKWDLISPVEQSDSDLLRKHVETRAGEVCFFSITRLSLSYQRKRGATWRDCSA